MFSVLLHWLPVHFKILMTVLKRFHSLALPQRSDLLHPYTPCTSLRSADDTDNLSTDNFKHRHKSKEHQNEHEWSG